MVYETLKELFIAICDSVRQKDGSVGLIDHQDIPDRILEIKGIDTSGATAEAKDIVNGKTAFVNGELVTGELSHYGDPWMIPNSSINMASKGSQIVANTKTTEDFYSRAGMNINFEIDKSRFGDARREDVAYGKTFTSKEGFVLTGTHECRPDEGIESSVEAETLSLLHYWSKKSTGATFEEVYNDEGAVFSIGSNTIQYGDDLVSVDGVLTLVNQQIFTDTTNDDAAEAALIGKYIYINDNYYRIPPDARIIYNSPTQYTPGSLRATVIYNINVIESGQVSIIVAENKATFPENGEENGFIYVYQGTLDTKNEAAIQSLVITENGTYTVPAGVDGYSPITVNVTAEDIPAVSQAIPVIELSTSDGLITVIATQDGGQVPAGTQKVTKQLPTQTAKTYTPGTSDQVIPAGKYLTGAQTIKGDANLKAENIKDGVTIFGIKGSYAGDGSQGNGSIEVANLSELHYWTKTDLSSGGPQESLMTSAILGTVGSKVSYADEITAAGDGLVNPQTYTVTKDASAAKELLAGKYVKKTSYLIRIPSEATFRFATLSYLGDSIMVEGAYEITPGSEPEVTLVVNADSAAYPENGERDGYTYVYQGTLSA